MKVLFRIALFVQMVGAVGTAVKAADVTEAELMRAATELARQYDAHYAAQDSAGMAPVRSGRAGRRRYAMARPRGKVSKMPELGRDVGLA